ncbi:Flp family type IVb pilin [Bordetella genomosp. 5]|uniref:Flp family type IVb pilin n=1 Tax=Bordetella genomosp. 5 TaxID=1395608 RepID=A0A261TAB5_9BORD|nr:Flp family type IVb pilin [Bordetella genomosp. 5]OZI39788.1 Flp family type IVb pilin [Bordetella genomosp. 5]OZI46539.1 Flp family type IVb pilin [Bordetella genomosp. 5]
MLEHVKSFWKDEEGATAIEYGLIAGLVAVAIIAALIALREDIVALFGRIGTALDGAGT